MTTRLALSFALSLATLLAPPATFAADTQTKKLPDPQTATTLDVTIPVRTEYLLYVPKDYDKAKPTPLMLFLHGAGERGTNLNNVKQHGPPKQIAAGKEFPCIVVSPQCAPEIWWEPVKLLALLDEVASKYNIDPERVYVTGLSMGGFGTWQLAAYAPERFAAILPICGGGEAFWAKRFYHIPAWTFHGSNDSAVPLVRSQQMVDALKKAGGEPTFTIYPDVGHDSWTATYDDPKVYEWLFAQKRKPVPPKEAPKPTKK